MSFERKLKPSLEQLPFRKDYQVASENQFTFFKYIILHYYANQVLTVEAKNWPAIVDLLFDSSLL